VRTIELLPELADSARARLARLGYRSVEVRQGDGWKGWPGEAPFEAIVVTAAPDRVPEALLEQLAPGGRLVVPVGPENGVQQLRLYAKDARGRIDWRVITEVLFVPMRGGAGDRGAAPGPERL
jgi:protein-L-isoaspartate(D-aspartate) O-methyltransferase